MATTEQKQNSGWASSRLEAEQQEGSSSIAAAGQHQGNSKAARQQPDNNR
jgi:hypothetical protein